ncbi:MAG: hypothetical protein AAGI66_08805 [Cyanobacteria bacterium P01_H01_bin.74]
MFLARNAAMLAQTSTPNLTQNSRNQHAKKFGLSASGQLKHLRVPITNEATGKRLSDYFGNFSVQDRPFGLSRQDVTSRVNVGTSIYMPAFFFSLFPHPKHFFETNGRNFIIWWLTLGFTLLTKNDQYGINPLMNFMLMNPKNHQPKAPGNNVFAKAFHHGIQRPLNLMTKPLRPSYNYFDLLEGLLNKTFSDSDRQKATWASLQSHENGKLQNEFDKLQDGSNKLTQLTQKLKIQNSKAALGKVFSNFKTRVLALKIAAGLVNMALAVYILGIAAMQFVLHYIAPLDYDFIPPSDLKNQNLKNKLLQKSQPGQALHDLPISMGRQAYGFNPSVPAATSYLEFSQYSQLGQYSEPVQQNLAVLPKPFSVLPLASQIPPPALIMQAPQPYYELAGMAPNAIVYSPGQTSSAAGSITAGPYPFYGVASDRPVGGDYVYR